MLHALMEAAPYLALIGLGATPLALFGRDRTADVHDLSDYHEAVPANDAPRSLRRYEALDRKPCQGCHACATEPLDALTAPLATLGPAVEAPIYEHMAARLILRKLGEDARAKAGIHPAVVSPASDRDLTGAFPVVRAA